MKIGITGGNGFVGTHLQVYLCTRDDIELIELADRATFDSIQKIDNFVNGKDLIVHLAGVNRANDEVLVQGNLQPAEQLVAAMKRQTVTPFVIYSSTTHADNPSSPYGEGKSGVSIVLEEWANSCGGRFLNMIIPHVFGEFGMPNYNSGTNTFCHHIANEKEYNVHGNGLLELVHAQDLVQQMLEGYSKGITGTLRVSGKEITVGQVVEKLELLHDEYKRGLVPNLDDHFDKCLFNTYRSYLPVESRQKVAVKHTDDRGWLVETVKVCSGGQSFVSTTKPGITRGNHFHLRKFERFFVLKGKASIKLRRIGSDDVQEYVVEEGVPGFIDIPTLHTHNITNIGDDELITFFWTNEFFDPEKPDTFFELVDL